MPTEQLNKAISDSIENGFIYSKYSLDKILNGYGSWKHDWVSVFNRLLRRIKKSGGSLYFNNENGQQVNNLLDSKRYMVIFYKPQLDGLYYIYDFKIDVIKTLKRGGA